MTGADADDLLNLKKTRCPKLREAAAFMAHFPKKDPFKNPTLISPYALARKIAVETGLSDYADLRKYADALGFLVEYDEYSGGAPRAFHAVGVTVPVVSGQWKGLWKRLRTAANLISACGLEVGAFEREAPFEGTRLVSLEKAAGFSTPMGRLLARYKTNLLQQASKDDCIEGMLMASWGLAFLLGSACLTSRRGAEDWVHSAECPRMRLTEEGFHLLMGGKVERPQAQVLIRFPVNLEWFRVEHAAFPTVPPVQPDNYSDY